MEDLFIMFGEMIKAVFGIIVDIWKMIWPMITIAASFILWVLAACIILPAVFIAGQVYPLWEKWGESF
jgi:hypothetical protein